MALTLDVHGRYEGWVRNALNYLPEEIYEEHVANLAILGMGHRDGVRLTDKTKQQEVIVLSDRILPRRKAKEDDPEVRYFIYAVLHEVAHAACKHLPPNELTKEQAEAQEAEADSLAMKWFNDHVKARNNRYLLPMTEEELDGHQERTRKKMDEAYEA